MSGFDVVVVGAGHAGCEAALACARLGLETLLMTLNIESIALMPCNPSVGGTGKGQLVREIDALGGQMGLTADQVTLQSRTLNRSKGPAVHSLRAQTDKRAYQSCMTRVLFSQEHLLIRQGEVMAVETKNGAVTAVRLVGGETIPCRAAVICTGVYLKSRIIIGEDAHDGGPQGLMPANELSGCLKDLGFDLRRYKTGTPARVDGRTIDFDALEVQLGDEPARPFSYLTDGKIVNRLPCYLTWTNEETHRIIRENLDRAPMFTGAITGVGARYCPSIETKIVRFADKDRHQLFIEPEGMDHPEWYIQGMSTSMPQDVQWAMYRSIRGLEHCVITRFAYAIEYDCIDSLTLKNTLGARDIGGLYFAGQINGTSGYEEAAAQGIAAGINAARYILEKPPVIFTRDTSYIGVMIDDLTTKGTDEPYRMMTSRAEYRLSIRQDSADLRLTGIGYEIGLAGGERMRRAERKAAQVDRLVGMLRDSGDDERIRKPGCHVEMPEDAGFDSAAVEEAEYRIKYEGYLTRERAMISKMRAMEDHALPQDAPYMEMDALRLEARQKLAAQRPETLGRASRIPGVSPADISVLTVWLMNNRKTDNDSNGGGLR